MTTIKVFNARQAIAELEAATGWRWGEGAGGCSAGEPTRPRSPIGDT
ncbi:hypothetical protein V1282_003594 [Nitrobacteraceae bacterium AZCC 2146]